MKTLHPPLPVLEESLFGPSDSLLQQIALMPDRVSEEIRQSVLSEPRYAAMVEVLRHPESEEQAPPAASIPAMPDWLSDLIARKVAAQAVRFSENPQPGQIRLVEEAIGPHGHSGLDLRHPLAVCLDRPYPGQPDIWGGWLTTPEVDYAGYWDVLLEEMDQPCDPLAGMVRLQVPVYVYLPSTSRTLCQLSRERLTAIRSAVAEMLSDSQPDVQPRPGHIAVRQTLGGHTVLTGTPLGGEDDPRWHYRALYEAMLPALREPVELVLDAARERVIKPKPKVTTRLQGMLQALQSQLEALSPTQWQPGPALGYAMGADVDESSPLEGELLHRLRFQADTDEQRRVLNLRLWKCCPDPLRVSLWNPDDLEEEHILNDAEPVVRLCLDAGQDYKLRLEYVSGQPLITLDLSVME